MFTLTIEDGNGRTTDRKSFEQGTFVVGRHEDCDIVLASASVSRQHARIFTQNGRCYVEDMGSSNGVVVDGQKVVGKRDLGTASQIKVGEFYIYLEYAPRASGAVLQTLFISDDSDHNKLVRINDSFAGEEFSLSELENTIGRTDDNFILLSDASISRHHARILREGERYTLTDLGSSNGTRLNGKAVKEPQILSHGDRILFGNVEFVYVPGHIDINPAEYAGSPGGGGVVLVAGLGVLVILVFVVGGLIAIGLSSMDDTQVGAPKVVADPVTSAISEGKARMQRRDWKGAISAFDHVATLDPSNIEAADLKKQAMLEQRAQQTFEKAESLVGEKKYTEAARIFGQIPAGTVAHERAADQIAHVQKTQAFDLRTQAKELLKGEKPKKSDLMKAHEKLKKALELSPEDGEAKSLIQEVETMAERRKIKL